MSQTMHILSYAAADGGAVEKGFIHTAYRDLPQNAVAVPGTGRRRMRVETSMAGTAQYWGCLILFPQGGPTEVPQANSAYHEHDVHEQAHTLKRELYRKVEQKEHQNENGDYHSRHTKNLGHAKRPRRVKSLTHHGFPQIDTSASIIHRFLLSPAHPNSQWRTRMTFVGGGTCSSDTRFASPKRRVPPCQTGGDEPLHCDNTGKPARLSE